MKKFLLAIAAVAACFSASAFTVEEICGEYDATGINLSQNFGIYKPGTTSTGVFPGLESTSWTMTITQVEGNKVKLSNFIPTGLNKDYADKGYTDGFPAVSFDIEGEFDGDKTITLNYTLVTYTRPDFASVKMPQNITKYDGATAFGTTCDDYKSEFPKTFTATFDENKNLTVEPWASYNNSAILNLLPTYGPDNTVGTYFTRKAESSGDNGSFSVEDICGNYKATGINLSQNFGIYKPGTTSTGVFPGLESTSWTMTITQVEGNKVKLSNFIPTGLNKDYADKGYTDGFPAVSFDIEGEFDGDKTITLNYTLVTYTRPDFASVKMPQNITKYDGATAFGTTCGDYKSEFPKTFTATFDENKNLTVEPWASYNNSAILNLLPTYGADNTVGTYFTRESSGIEAIEADTEAPVEYYNLQGVRVADPTPGLYIRRQGNKVTKVIVK